MMSLQRWINPLPELYSSLQRLHNNKILQHWTFVPGICKILLGHFRFILVWFRVVTRLITLRKGFWTAKSDKKHQHRVITAAAFSLQIRHFSSTFPAITIPQTEQKLQPALTHATKNMYITLMAIIGFQKLHFRHFGLYQLANRQICVTWKYINNNFLPTAEMGKTFWLLVSFDVVLLSLLIMSFRREDRF